MWNPDDERIALLLFLHFASEIRFCDALFIIKIKTLEVHLLMLSSPSIRHKIEMINKSKIIFCIFISVLLVE